MAIAGNGHSKFWGVVPAPPSGGVPVYYRYVSQMYCLLLLILGVR